MFALTFPFLNTDTYFTIVMGHDVFDMALGDPEDLRDGTEEFFGITDTTSKDEESAKQFRDALF